MIGSNGDTIWIVRPHSQFYRLLVEMEEYNYGKQELETMIALIAHLEEKNINLIELVKDRLRAKEIDEAKGVLRLKQFNDHWIAKIISDSKILRKQLTILLKVLQYKAAKNKTRKSRKSRKTRSRR